MLTKTFSTLLTVLLLSIVSAPSIVAAMGDSVDISMICDFSEEEEIKNFKVENIVVKEEGNSIDFRVFNNQTLVYYSNNYTKPHLNLFSPPPEFSI